MQQSIKLPHHYHHNYYCLLFVISTYTCSNYSCCVYYIIIVIINMHSLLSSGLSKAVYRAGFATAQEAYDKAVREVFESLDRVEGILSTQRYLTGSVINEAHVRLHTTFSEV